MENSTSPFDSNLNASKQPAEAEMDGSSINMNPAQQTYEMKMGKLEFNAENFKGP